MNSTSDCLSNQALQHTCDLTNQSWRPKSVDWQDAGHVVYTVFLFLIFTLGSIGNLLSIFVLSHPTHRNNILSPLMINLAAAGLLITVFGYPMSLSRLVTGTTLQLGQLQCTAYGFVNGVVGMASIGTFTEMSLVMNYCMHQMSPRFRVSVKLTFYLIAGAWVYGVLCMLPPLLGWTQFAPGNAAISCGPDWADVSWSGMAYSLILVVVGFVIPLSVISVSHFKMYRLLRQDFVPGNNHIRRRRRKSQIKLVRVTAATIVIFMLSWSPYCFVSIASVFKGGYAISAGEAEVPELMAKASFVYNPIVYVVMSKRFRHTLCIILTKLRCRWCVPKDSDKESNSGSKTQNYMTEVV